MSYTQTSPETKHYNFIINNSIATDKEICLVTDICGYSVETLNSIIFARTEYKSMEQCIECEPGNYIYDSEDAPGYDDYDEDDDE